MDKIKNNIPYTKKEFELSGDELRVPHILYIYPDIPACICYTFKLRKYFHID